MKATITAMFIIISIFCTHFIDENFHNKELLQLQIELKKTQIECLRWQLRYRYSKYLNSNNKLFQKRKSELRKNKKLMEFLKFD